jgi:hypothetical protein
VSKDPKDPAADGAAGQSMIPHTVAAVEQGHAELLVFLQEVVGDELNGRQIRGVASGVVRILTPLLRAGAIRDLAQMLEGSPVIPPEFVAAIRQGAEKVHGLYETEGVPDAGH